MALTVDEAVQETQLWPQQDARSPLGVWGARSAITGDASGGSVRGRFFVPAARRTAFVYTCYQVTMAAVSGTISAQNLKCQLLTNWPNVDPQAGIQGFSTLRLTNILTSTTFSNVPTGGPAENMLSENDRFILLFDPSGRAGDMFIVQLEFAINDNTIPYIFEAYGYYWDRSVMLTPGGPRHPGAS